MSRPVSFAARLLAAGIACLLILGGCGGSDEEEGSSSAGSSSSEATATPTPEKAAGDDFCEQAKAKQATGASFGELQAFLAKQELAKDVDSALSVMQGVTPPEEIADAWNTRKQYLTKVKSAVADLQAGARLDNPELVSDASASKASKTITDYWFANCQ